MVREVTLATGLTLSSELFLLLLDKVIHFRANPRSGANTPGGKGDPEHFVPDLVIPRRYREPALRCKFQHILEDMPNKRRRCLRARGIVANVDPQLHDEDERAGNCRDGAAPTLRLHTLYVLQSSDSASDDDSTCVAEL